MKWIGLGIIGVSILAGVSVLADDRDLTLTGRIDRVWEDGFQLQTDRQSIAVDTYDICGDYTTQHLSAGDQITLVGEFDEGEFDAFSVTKADGSSVCTTRFDD